MGLQQLKPQSPSPIITAQMPGMIGEITPNRSENAGHLGLSGQIALNDRPTGGYYSLNKISVY